MAQDCITIKGTRNGLLIVLDASRDFNELRSSLATRFAMARGFFQGAPFALLSTSPLSGRETAELEAICQQHGLVLGANIPLADRYRQPRTRHRPAPETAAMDAARRPRSDIIPPVMTAAVPALVADEATGGYPTLLNEGNLRNGQELACNGHVTLVGNIHPGAVIKAGGNIMVMGALLGSAYAGVSGDRNAVIVAHRLAPEQLGIAGVIACSPEHKQKRAYPEIARLIGAAIVVEPYLNRQNNR
jgi:septum site-determining protein MinC